MVPEGSERLPAEVEARALLAFASILADHDGRVDSYGVSPLGQRPDGHPGTGHRDHRSDGQRRLQHCHRT